MSAGDMQSVHYDKRGAKVTVAYDGEDCAAKKDEVEAAANKFCADNVEMASVSRLCLRALAWCLLASGDCSACGRRQL